MRRKGKARQGYINWIILTPGKHYVNIAQQLTIQEELVRSYKSTEGFVVPFVGVNNTTSIESLKMKLFK